MQYMVVSDIYGITPSLQLFAKHFKAGNNLVDPYEAIRQEFENEQQYYQYFINHGGHEQYLAKLVKYFNELTKPTTCIAFSAGASAAWRAQALTTNPLLKKLIAFYPTQIRHHTAINARVPCEFIFAAHETHFSVDAVIANLNKKAQVHCIKTPYQHGFMNQHAENFNQQGYRYFIKTRCDVHFGSA
ncbi:hypothetical protein [Pseudoalteromonas sp.]|uniref:hypothetical protein n=1 Tax=Pseudoalteromonas sp. TaxID=53249 RepID=UPI0035677B3D